MLKKNCTSCGGNSYSAYDDPKWRCPYCGKDIGKIPGQRFFFDKCKTAYYSPDAFFTRIIPERNHLKIL